MSSLTLPALSAWTDLERQVSSLATSLAGGGGPLDAAAGAVIRVGIRDLRWRDDQLARQVSQRSSALLVEQADLGRTLAKVERTLAQRYLDVQQLRGQLRQWQSQEALLRDRADRKQQAGGAPVPAPVARPSTASDRAQQLQEEASARLLEARAGDLDGQISGLRKTITQRRAELAPSEASEEPSTVARRLVEEAMSRQAKLLQEADERGVRLRAETDARARLNVELQSEHDSLTGASMGCGQQQETLEQLKTDLARAQIEDARLRAQAAAGAAEVRAECREMATAVLRRRDSSGSAAAVEAAALASSLASRKAELEQTAASHRSEMREAEARCQTSLQDLAAADQAEARLCASIMRLRADIDDQRQRSRETRQLSVPRVTGRLGLGESGSYSYHLSSPRRGVLPPTAEVPTDEVPPTASPMASPLKRGSLPRFGDPTPPKERPGKVEVEVNFPTVLAASAPTTPKAPTALPNRLSDVLRSGMSDLGGTGSGGLDAQIQDLESSLAAIIAGNDALEQRILSKSPSAVNVRGRSPTPARNPPH